MQLSAKEIQQMLGVQDREVIAHGYTFERWTVDIYFDDGKLVRLERKDNARAPEPVYKSSEDFEPRYFFDNIKRWYIGDQNGRGLNQKLMNLFETFSEMPLSTTAGGLYPERLCVADTC